MKGTRTVLLATMLGLFLGWIAPELTYADFQKVRINLLGMTCEFCERALEKNLSRVPGVKSARAWLDKGFAEVTLTESARLDIEKLARAVKDGGLTLKDFEVAAAGTLGDQGGNPVLRVSGNGQVLQLTWVTNGNYQALKGSEVTLHARIPAENVKIQRWEVKQINP